MLHRPKYPVYSKDSNPEPSAFGAEVTLTMLRLIKGTGKQTQRGKERGFKTSDFTIVIQDTRKKSRDVTSNY
jgi:hypothetical protein